MATKDIEKSINNLKKDLKSIKSKMGTAEKNKYKKRLYDMKDNTGKILHDQGVKIKKVSGDTTHTIREGVRKRPIVTMASSFLVGLGTAAIIKAKTSKKKT